MNGKIILEKSSRRLTKGIFYVGQKGRLVVTCILEHVQAKTTISNVGLLNTPLPHQPAR